MPTGFENEFTEDQLSDMYDDLMGIEGPRRPDVNSGYGTDESGQAYTNYELMSDEERRQAWDDWYVEMTEGGYAEDLSGQELMAYVATGYRLGHMTAEEADAAYSEAWAEAAAAEGWELQDDGVTWRREREGGGGRTIVETRTTPSYSEGYFGDAGDWDGSIESEGPGTWIDNTLNPLNEQEDYTRVVEDATGLQGLVNKALSMGVPMIVKGAINTVFGQALGPLIGGALQGAGLSQAAANAVVNGLAGQLAGMATGGDFDLEGFLTSALGGYLTEGGLQDLFGEIEGASGIFDGLTEQFENISDLIETGIDPIDAIIRAGGEDVLKQLVTTGEIDPQQLIMSMAQQGMVEGFDWVMEEYGDELFNAEPEYHILDEDGNIVHTFDDYDTAKAWADANDGVATADGTFYYGESQNEYPEWIQEMVEGGGGGAEAASQIIEAAQEAGWLPEVGANTDADAGDAFYEVIDGVAYIRDYETGELVPVNGAPDGLADGLYDDVWRPTDDDYDFTYDPGTPGDDGDVLPIEPVEPLPDPVEPLPDPVEPTPDPVEPTPDPVEPTPDPVEPTPDPVVPNQPAPEAPSRIEDVVTPIFDMELPGLEGYEGNDNYTDHDQNESDESSEESGSGTDQNGNAGTGSGTGTGNGSGDGSGDGSGSGDGVGDGNGSGSGSGEGTDALTEWSELFEYTTITKPELSKYTPQLKTLKQARGLMNDIFGSN